MLTILILGYELWTWWEWECYGKCWEQWCVCFECVSDVLARAQIIEKAAKVPARPCPLMIGAV